MNQRIIFSVKPAQKLLTATLSAVLLLSGSASWAHDASSDKPCPMPKPSPQHAWLQPFVGEWVSDTESSVEPGKPPAHYKGTMSIRPLGGFWTLSEVKSTMMDMPFTGVMTLGYDANKQKYVGTWVDSMTGKLWNYEGNLDASGKALVLETEGTCPMSGKLTKFKEVLELTDKNHQVFTSSMLGENGQWITLMTSHSSRKQ